MKTVFDVGMFDGLDTEYYLELGFRVTAVEANPEFVERARSRFASQIASGQLVCVSAAITPEGQEVELHLCGDDLGSSSLFRDRISSRPGAGSITVPGVTLTALFEQYGVPDFMKVDIEGADRQCILPLTALHRPRYLSFEVGLDVDELLAHAISVGYNHFKVVNQNAFREPGSRWYLKDAVAYQLMRMLGYADYRLVRRSGRFFVGGHSSGPPPWMSGGRWHSAARIRDLLRRYQASGLLTGWNDIHAAVEPE